MKKFCWSCLSGLIVFALIISSAMLIIIECRGSGFDPIAEIVKLKDHDRRDDALDLVTFFKQNGKTEPMKLSEIEKDLQYSQAEKFKSFIWNGAIKGQVYDSYSGLGAISADLCLIGDVRDLGIQSWKYLTNSDDFDRFIFILSAAGIGLTTTSFINGTNALVKNILKYLKQMPSCLNKGMLKLFLAGKLSCHQAEKLWTLLKKTTGQFPTPYPAYPASMISNTLTPPLT